MSKAPKQVTELTISTATFIKVALLIIVTIIAIAALRKASHALLLLFVAFFLALALNAPVYFISRHLPGKLKGSRIFGTTTSFLIVVIIIGLFAAYIIPHLVKQTESFVAVAPHLVKEFRSQNGAVGELIRKYHLQSQINTLSTQLSSRLHNIGGAAFSTITKIGDSVFSLVTILALTFMMLVEGPRWLAFARKLTPSRSHNAVDRVASEMHKVIKGYVNGQVTLAAIAALLITPGLLILHIGYPIALIVIIFICGLIPMVGHLLGAVIVTIVALFHSTSAGLIILIYYILYIQLENYVIQPKIQANSTNMSPLLVFSSLVIGINFAGLFGGLVAIPLAGCLRILVLEYLNSRHIINSSDVDEAESPS